MTDAAIPARCPVCGGATEPYLNDLYDDRYGYPGTFAVRACGSCAHRFVAASFTEDELASLYGRYYPRSLLRLEDFRPYTEARGFRAWFQGEKASAFRWVPPAIKILDIGCGFGETLAYHQSRGCDAHGVEADDNILRVAERYGLNARAGLFNPADYEPESFDYVTLDQVIEHVASPVAFLQGVAAVLRPGGTVILSTPNGRGFGARAFGRRWINWHVPYHLQQFTRRSLGETARRSGLDVSGIVTITNSAWMQYQFMHLLSCPPPGEASPFWDPGRSAGHMPRGANRVGRMLEKTKLFHILTRLTDVLGLGDNLLCILRKPA